MNRLRRAGAVAALAVVTVEAGLCNPWLRESCPSAADRSHVAVGSPDDEGCCDGGDECLCCSVAWVSPAPSSHAAAAARTASARLPDDPQGREEPLGVFRPPRT